MMNKTANNTCNKTNNNRDAILQQLSMIPKGQVSTYGSIAKAAGLPGYARFVGQVLKTLPKGTKLPWHRVVNAQGKISFPEGSDAFLEQKKRLVNEGIELKNNRINLKHTLCSFS